MKYFYNASYNHGSKHGPVKSVWGIATLDITKPLQPQIEYLHSLRHEMVIDFSMESFNPVDTSLVESAKSFLNEWERVCRSMGYRPDHLPSYELLKGQL